ncbi:MAG TPA: hypothetical protein VGE74_22760 [Gemmata sp.]
MTKLQQHVLTAFADMGAPASTWEALGAGTPAGTSDALHALLGAGLLLALPYRETRDRHGGTRFRVTRSGLVALGRPAPGTHTGGRARATGTHFKHRR